jgi:hypothetical protein
MSYTLPPSAPPPPPPPPGLTPLGIDVTKLSISTEDLTPLEFQGMGTSGGGGR